MAIFFFSRWRPAAILDFNKVKNGVTARCGQSMSGFFSIRRNSIRRTLPIPNPSPNPNPTIGIRRIEIRRIERTPRAKFGDNISNGGRHFSQMAAAILDFALAQKQHQGTLRDANGHQHTKLGKDT